MTASSPKRLPEQAAHRLTVGWRSDLRDAELYACQLIASVRPRTKPRQIARPRDGQAMRGGLRPWFRARHRRTGSKVPHSRHSSNPTPEEIFGHWIFVIALPRTALSSLLHHLLL